MRRGLWICFILMSLLWLAIPAEATVFVPANDSRIQYWGRVYSENSIVNLDWPGTTIVVKFTGRRIKMRLLEPTKNTWWIRIDNQDWRRFDEPGTATEFEMTDSILSEGEHTLIVSKKNESGWGYMRVVGFILEDGEKVLPPPARPSKSIEFIGDSITAGFAVHGPYNNKNGDGRLTYGYVASMDLGVEPIITAVSGIGLSHNLYKMSDVGTLPKAYDRINNTVKKHQMDGKPIDPAIITVNLGTNDSDPMADPLVFQTHAYAFLKQLRSHHPQSWILVMEPFKGMFEEQWRNAITKIQTKDKDSKVVFIKTDGWLDPKKGSIDGTHPNEIGNRGIADKLVPILREYLEK